MINHWLLDKEDSNMKCGEVYLKKKKKWISPHLPYNQFLL